MTDEEALALGRAIELLQTHRYFMVLTIRGAEGNTAVISGCLRCGALVEENWKAAHDSWHEGKL